MDKINKQHSQVPNNMAKDGLTPREQLVYAVLHAHNSPNNECFPSLQTLSEESQLSIPTLRNSIKILEETGYIKVKKVGRKNYYYFTKYVKFEPFSPDFLKRKDITPTTKAYLIAAQQFMYKDIEGVGKISFSNNNLSEQINMPESSIRKCNTELVRKNYLTIVKNKSRDIETGCKTDTKIFNLNELGQAIIWVLQNHEERIEQNTNDINELRKQVEKQNELINKQQELIDKLLEERKAQDKKYTL